MSTTYKTVIWFSKEDNALIAEVPQLPGCMAEAETESELLENIQRAIDRWIQKATHEGREIPRP